MSTPRRQIMLAAVLVISVGALYAQAPRGRGTLDSGGAVAADVGDSLRQVTEFEVNGLKVLVKRREGSQTVAAGLFIRGGSRNITAENAGVEALMLDMASEGTANFPRERLRRELARTGTVLGGGADRDYSVLQLGSTRQYFDRAWEIFTDAALHPSFATDDFDRLKQQELIALGDDEDTPDSYLQVLTDRQIYVGHPYLNDPHGTLETMRRLTLNDVKHYHEKIMQTSRLLLVAVGDIDAKAFQAKVAESFGKLPRGTYKEEAMPTLSFAAPTVTITARELPTNYVRGVYVAPPITSPDIYPMRVATAILQERFFNEIRVKRSLSYAPDASLQRSAANTGAIYFTAVDANQTAQVMLTEIARLQKELIRPDEISAVAQQFLTTYYMGQERNAEQAQDLAEYELIGGGWRNSADVLERLRAVTPEDVRRVANTYIRNLQFIVLGNPRSIDKNIFTK
jgi:zinc protease